MRDVGVVTRAAATRSHCLRGQLLDADPAAPGLQPTCRVEAARDVGTTLETRVDVPPCVGAAGGSRCFTLAVDADCAETSTQLAFRVSEPADNETLMIVCDVEGDGLADHSPRGETRAPE
jgi:hypothetical protein